ncbi:glycoside hydrolase family 9 protein [Planctomycetota bacterium]
MIRTGSVLTAMALLVMAAAGYAQEAQAPGPGPKDGTIVQGPFMLFGDAKGGIHLMSGSELVIKGAGIECGNGGHWPHDRMTNIKITRGKGSLAFRGEVPGKGISYEHHISIDGNRIKFKISRTGAWQNGGWDSFFFKLRLEYFKGKKYSVNGTPGIFPVKYIKGKDYVTTNAKKLECQPDNNPLNFIFESGREFAISEERRWSGQSYRVGFGVPRGGNNASTEFYLTLPQVPDFNGSFVRYSRIGYPVKGPKFVILEWPQRFDRPDDAVSLKSAGGKTVKQGTFGPTSDYTYMQSSFAAFDFSEIKTPGKYTLEWSAGKTRIEIKPSVFEDRLWEPTLDYFIPFLMCHAKVDLGKYPDHEKCHMDDGIRVPPNYPDIDQFRSYACEGVPWKAGEAIPCARGGWHDAGDCDLNINAQGFTVWVLSLAYEEFGIKRDKAALDLRQQKFKIGRPDRKNDILQQIEWGALWLLSMMRPDGRSLVGLVAQPHLYQSNGRRWKDMTDNKPGTGDERHVYVDYHPQLQLMQAISLSAAGRALKKHNPTLSKKCLENAVQAYAYFKKAKEEYRPTVYFNPDRKGRDCMVAGALAELYLTTRDKTYLNELEIMKDTIAGLKLSWPNVYASGSGNFWYGPPMLARVYPLLQAGPLKDAIYAACKRAAETQASFAKKKPWPFEYWHFGSWGNNGGILSRIFDAYWLGKVVPDTFTVHDSSSTMLWIFGLHPLNDRIFVSGLGYPGPEHIHSGQIRALFGNEPGTVPGVLVPGISGVNAYIPENTLFYIDDGHHHNNEATIYKSCMYVFAINALQKSGY